MCMNQGCKQGDTTPLDASGWLYSATNKAAKAIPAYRYDKYKREGASFTHDKQPSGKCLPLGVAKSSHNQNKLYLTHSTALRHSIQLVPAQCSDVGLKKSRPRSRPGMSADC